MKRYRVKLIRVGDSNNPLSVAEMVIILEDNTGDDIAHIEMWAEDFVFQQMRGYSVSEIVELA